MSPKRKAPPQSPVEALQDQIRQVQLNFSVFYGVNLAKHGVTIRQFSILVALVRLKQLKMSELARALHVSFPAITHLVDQLEKNQLVTRDPDPTDRRVNWISLTSHGAKVTAETQGKAMRLISGILLKFPPQERETVVRFMKTMSSELASAVKESA